MGELAIDGGNIRSDTRRDQDIFSDEVLPVDAVQLLLSWELVEQGVNRGCSVSRRISEQSVLQGGFSLFSKSTGAMTLTQ